MLGGIAIVYWTPKKVSGILYHSNDRSSVYFAHLPPLIQHLLDLCFACFLHHLGLVTHNLAKCHDNNNYFFIHTVHNSFAIKRSMLIL